MYTFQTCPPSATPTVRPRSRAFLLSNSNVTNKTQTRPGVKNLPQRILQSLPSGRLIVSRSIWCNSSHVNVFPPNLLCGLVGSNLSQSEKRRTMRCSGHVYSILAGFTYLFHSFIHSVSGVIHSFTCFRCTDRGVRVSHPHPYSSAYSKARVDCCLPRRNGYWLPGSMMTSNDQTW